MTFIRSSIVVPVFDASDFVGALLDSLPSARAVGAAVPGASLSAEAS